MARLEAVCRRSAARPSPILEIGDLCLNLASQQLARAGKDINLSPTEFSIVEFLMVIRARSWRECSARASGTPTGRA